VSSFKSRDKTLEPRTRDPLASDKFTPSRYLVLSPPMDISYSKGQHHRSYSYRSTATYISTAVGIFIQTKRGYGIPWHGRYAFLSYTNDY
jgi:hypothetical protein